MEYPYFIGTLYDLVIIQLKPNTKWLLNGTLWCLESVIFLCSHHFLSILFIFQDEEQDPLLNSFGQLKEMLNNIKGMLSSRGHIYFILFFCGWLD